MSNSFTLAGDFQAAISDAQRSLQFSPKFTKGFYRLAKAHLEMNKDSIDKMDGENNRSGSKSTHLHQALVALQGGLLVDPKNKDLLELMQQVTHAVPQPEGHSRVNQPVEVKYRLVPVGERGDTQAIFEIPAELVSQIVTKEVSARGSRFALTKGPAAEPSTVSTIFYSPTPEVTADAIAERLALRIQDPNPPGAEECSVM